MVHPLYLGVDALPLDLQRFVTDLREVERETQGERVACHNFLPVINSVMDVNLSVITCRPAGEGETSGV